MLKEGMHENFEREAAKKNKTERMRRMRRNEG